MVSQHDRFVTARGPENRWIGWADRVFLWVPNATRPGLLAYGLGLARATLFPLVLLSIAAFVATELTPGHRLADADAFGQDLALATFVVFEELARYAYARKAHSLGRAIVLFTVLTIVVESVFYYKPGMTPAAFVLTRGPSWIVHLVAGGALFLALRRRWPIVPAVAGIILAHSAFDIWTAHSDFARKVAAEAIRDQGAAGARR